MIKMRQKFMFLINLLNTFDACFMNQRPLVIIAIGVGLGGCGTPKLRLLMQLKRGQHSDCLAAWCPATSKGQKLLLATAFRLNESSASPSTQNNGSTRQNSYLELVSCNLNVDAHLSDTNNLDAADYPTVELLLPVGAKLLVPDHQKVTQLVWPNSSNAIVCGFANGSLALCTLIDDCLLNNADGTESDSIESFKSPEFLWQPDINEEASSIVCLNASQLDPCLLCSGDSRGAVLVWDVNRLEAGPTASASTTLGGAARCVAWNCQVASVFAAVTASTGSLAVYDARRSGSGSPKASSQSSLSPLMSLTPAGCGVTGRMALFDWHPAVATQLCLASDDDKRPVVQLWDLRFATSPVTQFDRHSDASVLSMAWNSRDPGCLLSSDSSGRLLCWDPKPCGAASSFADAVSSAENDRPTLLARAHLIGRCADNLAWCPSQPGLFSASTTDGQLGIFNILGGSFGLNCPEDSDYKDFDDKDYDRKEEGRRQRLRTLSRVSAHSAALAAASSTEPVAGDPFADVQQPAGPILVRYNPARPFHWLVNGSSHRVGGRCCARFGFGGRLVVISNASAGAVQLADASVVNLENDNSTMSLIVRRAVEFDSAIENAGDELGSYCGLRVAELIGQQQPDNKSSVAESEAKLWRFLEANFSSNPRFDFIRLLGFDVDNMEMIDKDKDDQDEAKLIAALVSGQLEAAIELCIANGRLNEALLLSSSWDQVSQLFYRTRTRVLSKLSGDTVGRLVQAIVSGTVPDYVIRAEIDSNWRAQLALALTYIDEEKFPSVAESIARRLVNQNDPFAAAVCYSCSGSWFQLVNCLLLLLVEEDKNNLLAPKSLARMQLALQAGEILRRAFGSDAVVAEGFDRRQADFTDAVVELYAQALAGCGQLSAALNCCLRQLATLPSNCGNHGKLVELTYRLWRAVGDPAVFSATSAARLTDPFAQLAAQTTALIDSALNRQPRPGQPGVTPALPYEFRDGGYGIQQPLQQLGHFGAGYAVPPPPASIQPGAGYAVPPPAASIPPAAGHAVPPPAASSPPAAGYAVPPPAASSPPAAGHAVPPLAASSPPAAGYAVPPPAASIPPAAGYAVPPPAASSPPAAGHAVPPPAASSPPAAGYAVPPPAASIPPAAGYAVPPPAASSPPAAGYAVPQTYVAYYNPLASTIANTAPPPIKSQTYSTTENLSLFRKTKPYATAAVSAAANQQQQQQFYNPTAWSAVSAQPPPLSPTSQLSQPAARSEHPASPDQSTSAAAANLAVKLSAALTSLATDCRRRAENLLASRLAAGGAGAVKLRHVIAKMNDAEKRAVALKKFLTDSCVSQPVIDGLNSFLACLERENLPEALISLNKAMQSGSFVELRSYMPSLKMLIQSAIEMRQA